MNETFDLIVVGSGGGALTAAQQATRAGLTTLVLEATALVGGVSAYSGGSCWLPGSAVPGRAGIPDSTVSARSYLAALLGGGASAKVDAFLAHAPELVAQLEADGLAFAWVPFPEYFHAPGRVALGRSIQPASVRRRELPPDVAALIRPPVERDRAGAPGRSTLTGGQALIARLLTMVRREGGIVRTGHRVTDLLTADGQVIGVTAQTADGPVTLRASRGVLLAAGGFERNQTLRDRYGVPGSAAWTMAPPGTNTGEPILAAVALGAATELLDQAWFCPGLAQVDGTSSFTLGFRGGLIVDQTGRRYANECLPYDRFGRAMAAAPERIPSWLVFDSREGGQLPALAMPEGDAADQLAAGIRVSADSIKDLAAGLAMDAGQLVETVDRFNGFAGSGVDEDFGRGTDEYDLFFAGGDGPNPALVPVTEPPYYAARFVLSDLGTKGGLVTDAAARVLRADGSVIAGLYAVGNTAASMVGPVYPAPGVPLGTAMVFASLAVRDLRTRQ